VASRVAVPGLQRIGEGLQAVEEAALHAPVGLLEIRGIAQGLAMAGAEARVHVLELSLALLPDLADGLEVAGIGEGLG
jgi:hypothetical protein